jgi:Zn-dependent protease with chaperone function
MAAFALPYRNAIQMAQDEINAKGGALGRPLEFVFRDDGSTPGDAVRVAEELLTRENVTFLAGTFLSNVGLAVSDFANQRKRLFFATEPLSDALAMAQGNRYTWRLRPNTYMQTRMLTEAARGRTARRWAIVAPNYEYGQSAAANFKRLITSAIPGAEIVAEQYPALGRIDAGATVGALGQARPDAIFNVLFGPDLTAFATPGGCIYINRGLQAYIDSEAEMAGVLAHEIGHVTANHSARQQTANIANKVVATTAYILTGSGELADAFYSDPRHANRTFKDAPLHARYQNKSLVCYVDGTIELISNRSLRYKNFTIGY